MKRVFLLFAFIIGFLLSSIAANAVTYYVDATTGNDANSGTISTAPLATIQAAVNKSDVETIRVKGDGAVYSENVDIQPGKNNLTITGYGGSNPILDGTGAPSKKWGIRVRSDYVTIENMIIRDYQYTSSSDVEDFNTAGAGIASNVNVTGLTLQNNTIYDCNHGMFLKEVVSSVIRNNTIYDMMKIECTTPACGGVGSGVYKGGNGIKVFSEGVNIEDNSITNNTVYQCENYGIWYGASSGTVSGDISEINNNTIYDCYNQVAGGDNDPDPEGFAIGVYNISGILSVEYNTLTENYFGLDISGLCMDVFVHGNNFYETRGSIEIRTDARYDGEDLWDMWLYFSNTFGETINNLSINNVPTSRNTVAACSNSSEEIAPTLHDENGGAGADFGTTEYRYIRNTIEDATYDAGYDPTGTGATSYYTRVIVLPGVYHGLPSAYGATTPSVYLGEQVEISNNGAPDFNRNNLSYELWDYDGTWIRDIHVQSGDTPLSYTKANNYTTVTSSPIHIVGGTNGANANIFEIDAAANVEIEGFQILADILGGGDNGVYITSSATFPLVNSNTFSSITTLYETSQFNASPWYGTTQMPTTFDQLVGYNGVVVEEGSQTYTISNNRFTGGLRFGVLTAGSGTIYCNHFETALNSSSITTNYSVDDINTTGNAFAGIAIMDWQDPFTTDISYVRAYNNTIWNDPTSTGNSFASGTFYSGVQIGYNYQLSNDYTGDFTDIYVGYLDANSYPDAWGNAITRTDIGVYVEDLGTAASSNTFIMYNNLSGDILARRTTATGTEVSITGEFFDNDYAVYNADVDGLTADAGYNWWGKDDGPTHISNAYQSGSVADYGSRISDNVDYMPWLIDQTPIATASCGYGFLADASKTFGPIYTATTLEGTPVEWFTTIQAAIDDANTVWGENWYIHVGNGVFREHVDVNKNVYLTVQPNVSEGSCTIDPGYGSPASATGSSMTISVAGASSHSLTIDGFHIGNSSTNFRYIPLVIANNAGQYLRLESNTFDARGNTVAGINIDDDDIVNNDFYNNLFLLDGTDVGIGFSDVSGGGYYPGTLYGAAAAANYTSNTMSVNNSASFTNFYSNTFTCGVGSYSMKMPSMASSIFWGNWFRSPVQLSVTDHDFMDVRMGNSGTFNYLNGNAANNGYSERTIALSINADYPGYDYKGNMFWSDCDDASLIFTRAYDATSSTTASGTFLPTGNGIGLPIIQNRFLGSDYAVFFDESLTYSAGPGGGLPSSASFTSVSFTENWFSQITDGSPTYVPISFDNFESNLRAFLGRYPIWTRYNFWGLNTDTWNNSGGGDAGPDYNGDMNNYDYSNNYYGTSGQGQRIDDWYSVIEVLPWWETISASFTADGLIPGNYTTSQTFAPIARDDDATTDDPESFVTGNPLSDYIEEWFFTIQGALADAQTDADDHIHVMGPGTYVEQGDFILTDNNLHFFGPVDPTTWTTYDTQAILRAVPYSVGNNNTWWDNNSNTVSFTNLTFDGRDRLGTSYDGNGFEYAVYIDGGSASFYETNFTNISSTMSGTFSTGIGVTNSGTLTVNNAQFDEVNKGVWAMGTSTFTVGNSTFNGSTAATWPSGTFSYGVEASDGAFGTITNSSFLNHSLTFGAGSNTYMSTGIYVNGPTASTVTMTDNTIRYNYYGVAIGSSSVTSDNHSTTITDNIFEYNGRLYGYPGYGGALINNQSATISAESNWWGDEYGPENYYNAYNRVYHSVFPGNRILGLQDGGAGRVDYTPWYISSAMSQLFAPIIVTDNSGANINSRYFANLDDAYGYAGATDYVNVLAGVYSDNSSVTVSNIEILGRRNLSEEGGYPITTWASSWMTLPTAQVTFPVATNSNTCGCNTGAPEIINGTSVIVPTTFQSLMTVSANNVTIQGLTFNTAKEVNYAQGSGYHPTGGVNPLTYNTSSTLSRAVDIGTSGTYTQILFDNNTVLMGDNDDIGIFVPSSTVTGQSSTFTSSTISNSSFDGPVSRRSGWYVINGGASETITITDNCITESTASITLGNGGLIVSQSFSDNLFWNNNGSIFVDEDNSATLARATQTFTYGYNDGTSVYDGIFVYSNTFNGNGDANSSDFAFLIGENVSNTATAYNNNVNPAAAWDDVMRLTGNCFFYTPSTSYTNPAVGFATTSPNPMPSVKYSRPIFAECNWWASQYGPTNATTNPFGTGSNVSERVRFAPWTTDGCGGTNCEGSMVYACDDPDCADGSGVGGSFINRYFASLQSAIDDPDVVDNGPILGNKYIFVQDEYQALGAYYGTKRGVPENVTINNDCKISRDEWTSSKYEAPTPASATIEATCTNPLASDTDSDHFCNVYIGVDHSTIATGDLDMNASVAAPASASINCDLYTRGDFELPLTSSNEFWLGDYDLNVYGTIAPGATYTYVITDGSGSMSKMDAEGGQYYDFPVANLYYDVNGNMTGDILYWGITLKLDNLSYQTGEDNRIGCKVTSRNPVDMHTPTNPIGDRTIPLWGYWTLECVDGTTMGRDPQASILGTFEHDLISNGAVQDMAAFNENQTYFARWMGDDPTPYEKWQSWFANSTYNGSGEVQAEPIAGINNFNGDWAIFWGTSAYALNAEPTQADFIKFLDATDTSLRFRWNRNGDAQKFLVIMDEGSETAAATIALGEARSGGERPNDGVDYSNTTRGTNNTQTVPARTPILNGNTSQNSLYGTLPNITIIKEGLYDNSTYQTDRFGGELTITGLTQGTYYAFMVCNYNGEGDACNYNIDDIYTPGVTIKRNQRDDRKTRPAVYLTFSDLTSQAAINSCSFERPDDWTMQFCQTGCGSDKNVILNFEMHGNPNGTGWKIKYLQNQSTQQFNTNQNDLERQVLALTESTTFSLVAAFDGDGRIATLYDDNPVVTSNPSLVQYDNYHWDVVAEMHDTPMVTVSDNLGYIECEGNDITVTSTITGFPTSTITGWSIWTGGGTKVADVANGGTYALTTSGTTTDFVVNADGSALNINGVDYLYNGYTVAAQYNESSVCTPETSSYSQTYTINVLHLPVSVPITTPYDADKVDQANYGVYYCEDQTASGTLTFVTDDPADPILGTFDSWWYKEDGGAWTEIVFPSASFTRDDSGGDYELYLLDPSVVHDNMQITAEFDNGACASAWSNTWTVNILRDITGGARNLVSNPTVNPVCSNNTGVNGTTTWNLNGVSYADEVVWQLERTTPNLSVTLAIESSTGTWLNPSYFDATHSGTTNDIIVNTSFTGNQNTANTGSITLYNLPTDWDGAYMNAYLRSYGYSGSNTFESCVYNHTAADAIDVVLTPDLAFTGTNASSGDYEACRGDGAGDDATVTVTSTVGNAVLGWYYRIGGGAWTAIDGTEAEFDLSGATPTNNTMVVHTNAGVLATQAAPFTVEIAVSGYNPSNANCSETITEDLNVTGTIQIQGEPETTTQVCDDMATISVTTNHDGAGGLIEYSWWVKNGLSETELSALDAIDPTPGDGTVDLSNFSWFNNSTAVVTNFDTKDVSIDNLTENDDVLSYFCVISYAGCSTTTTDKNRGGLDVMPELTQPTGLAVTGHGAGHIDISWDQIPDISGYQIFWADGSGTTSATVTNSANPTYQITGLNLNTQYWIGVAGHNFQLSAPDCPIGPWSATVTETTNNPQYTVAWIAPDNGTFDDVTLNTTETQTYGVNTVAPATDPLETHVYIQVPNIAPAALRMRASIDGGSTWGSWVTTGGWLEIDKAGVNDAANNEARVEVEFTPNDDCTTTFTTDLQHTTSFTTTAATIDEEINAGVNDDLEGWGKVGIPTTQVTDLYFDNESADRTQIDLNWTNPVGSAGTVLVIVSRGSSTWRPDNVGGAFTEDYAAYPKGGEVGKVEDTDNQIDPNVWIVYNSNNDGPASDVTLTNMTAGVDYWAYVYHFSACGGEYAYNTTVGANTENADRNPYEVVYFKFSSNSGGDVIPLQRSSVEFNIDPHANPLTDPSNDLDIQVGLVTRSGADYDQVHNGGADLTVTVSNNTNIAGTADDGGSGVSTGAPVTIANSSNTSGIFGYTWNYAFGLPDSDNGYQYAQLMATSANNAYLTGYSNTFGLIAEEPTVQARNLIWLTATCNTLQVRWINGNGKGRLLVSRQGANPELPTDGVDYLNVAYEVDNDDNADYENADTYGTATHILEIDKSTSRFSNNIDIAGIPENEIYYYRVFEFNGEGIGINYNLNTNRFNPSSRRQSCDAKLFDAGTFVEVENYKAYSAETQVYTSWRTTIEQGIAGFEVRRLDLALNPEDEDFVTVGHYNRDAELVGLGNSFTGKEYRFIDNDVKLKVGNEYVYQLIAYGYDGTRFELGQRIVKVLSNPMAMAHLIVTPVTPNPTSGDINFTIELASEQQVTVEVVDMTGRKVSVPVNGQSYGAGVHTITIPLEGLSSGMYLLNVNAGGDNAMQRFMYVK